MEIKYSKIQTHFLNCFNFVTQTIFPFLLHANDYKNSYKKHDISSILRMLHIILFIKVLRTTTHFKMTSHGARRVCLHQYSSISCPNLKKTRNTVLGPLACLCN